VAQQHITPGWAIYLRVSDEDKQTPERSFAMQRRRIQDDLICHSDIPTYREYIDLLSGSNPNRRDYQELLADAEAGKFSRIALYRADRFGRNTVEGLQATQKLNSLGIQIRVASMPSLRPEEPDGFFMFLIQMGMAQREIEVLAQRTGDGMEAKLRAGGWAHKAPDGYLNKERLVSSNKYDRWVEIDPSYQPVLKDAWALLITERFTLKEICEELSRKGHTRASGRPWAWNDPESGKRCTADNILHKVFHNPFYAGWVTSERFGIKIGEIRGNWEPIVTNEQFQRGLHILHKHDGEKSREKRHVYLLRDLLWVQNNEKVLKLYVSTPSGRYQSYSYYISHAKINGKSLHIQTNVVDDQIPAWLHGIAVDPQLIPAIRNIYKSDIQKTTAEDQGRQIIELRKRLSMLKDEEARLGRLYITDKISDVAYKQLHSEWQEKLRNAELQLVELEREPSIHINDLEMALMLLTKLDELYPRLDDRQKSTLLRILAAKIIIDINGQIVDHVLNAPFLYLWSIADKVSHPGIKELDNQNPDSFMSNLRFDHKEKIMELPLDIP